MFSFDGDFSGAFREIPLREASRSTRSPWPRERPQYRPAGARSSSARPARDVRHDSNDKGVRIVWHYQAQSSRGASESTTGCAASPTAYDDVVDVNVKVWGDEWEVSLGQLTATVVAPGPTCVRGDTRRRPRRRDIDGTRAEPPRTRHSSAASSSSCARSSRAGSSPRPPG